MPFSAMPFSIDRARGVVADQQQRHMYARRRHRRQHPGDEDIEPVFEPRLKEASPYGFFPEIDHHDRNSDGRNCLPIVERSPAVERPAEEDHVHPRDHQRSRQQDGGQHHQ
jgi:hypothetical protein